MNEKITQVKDEIKWTKEQLEAIEDRGHNLLVSASAGSGKTTVMIKRIVDLVVKDKIPISNFLVVTFTKASASDMKKKLIDELFKCANDDFVLEQIEDVEISNISNLHSFCSRLISIYFYEVGIDPAYRIIDETESTFLKDKALSRLFEKKEKDGSVEYFELFDIFQKKRNDKPLKEIIKRFNNFLNASLDGKAWFEETLNTSHDLNFERNACAKIINNHVCFYAQKDAQKADELAKVCFERGHEKLYDYFVELSSKLRTINFKNSFLTNAKNVFEIDFDRRPSANKDSEDKDYVNELASKLNDKIKDDVANFKDNFVSGDEQILKDGLVFAKKKLTDLFELVQEFDEIYSALKREVNGLDFNDLEKCALKILENKEILEAVKNKYQYVFVDEYQDINAVQEKIISLVSGKNNRFMVGDVKQSIYRFRLCDPDIFLQKYSEYGKGGEFNKLIKLNCNFRSDKKILKFVDKVFSGVMTPDFGGVDYAKDSVFVAGEKNLDGKNAVNLCFIDTTKESAQKEEVKGVYSVKEHKQEESEETMAAIAEAKFVANKIAELVNPLNENAIKFSDIAVLVGSRNESTSKFIEVLNSFGIPVSGDEKRNLMQSKNIQEIVNFVKLACNEKDDFVLFKVLKSRLFGFSDAEIIEIRKLDLKARFFDCARMCQKLENEKLKEKIQNFLTQLEKFNKFSKLLSLKELVEKIINDFCLNKINYISPNGELLNDEYDKFLKAVPDTDAHDFVLNYSNFQLETESECSDDNVKVMTIHKSKGIEFKAVFLINTSNNFNFMSTRGNILFNKALGVSMDYFDLVSRTEISTLAISAIRLIERRKLIEEQQRVFYVALTRAVEKMFIVCSKPQKQLCQKTEENQTSFSNWIESIISKELDGNHDENLNFEAYALKELLDSVEGEEKQLVFTRKTEEKPNWFVYKNPGSVSVPLKNSISKILKNKQNLDDEYEQTLVFGESSSSAKRGVIYHKVFQNLNLKNLQTIDEQLSKIKNLFTKEEWTVVNEKNIKNVLNQQFFEKIEQDDVILQEREFYAKMPAKIAFNEVCESDEFVLQGVVDLLVVKKDEMWILDYKTGKIDDERLEKYKFQLNTYAEVCERAFGKKVTKRCVALIDLQKILEI